MPKYDDPNSKQKEEVEIEPKAVRESAIAELSEIPDQLIEAKRAIEKRLMASMAESAPVQAENAVGENNIVGVGIGFADPESGAVTGEPGLPVLNVYVMEKTDTAEVRSAVVESMGVSFAENAAEVPIQVVKTGIVDAQPHRFRMRPAPGGISVGHFKITAGTIGCTATGRSAPRNNRMLILSNNHVIANSNAASYGDCISQPGPADGGKCPADQIAILERFVPMNFSGGANYVDCATGWCWPERVRRELVYLSGGSPAFFKINATPVAATQGMLVGKSGRTTQLTVGRVIGISETVRVNYGGGRVGLFVDQLSIRGLSGDFSAGGDSGSTIWTWNAQRNPVGLLFAGGGGITFANKIQRVLTALDIKLVT